MHHKVTITRVTPMVGGIFPRWHVECHEGCNLGTSRLTPTYNEALKRAELHELATAGYTRDES